MTYDLCAECERPIRPKRTSLSDHPDTLAPGALGKRGIRTPALRESERKERTAEVAA